MNTPPPGVDSVLHSLRQRERAFGVKVALLLLIGLPSCLFGPAVLATMVWGSGAMWTRSLSPPVIWLHWSVLFAIFCVVALPMLFGLEVRSQGQYLSQSMCDAPDYSARTRGLALHPVPGFGMVTHVAANRRALMTGLVEVFLFGPRLVIDAVTQIRTARRLRGADRRQAAKILSRLLAHAQGVSLREIIPQQSEREECLPALAYLAFHRWIGAKDGWQHLWVWTEARERLLRHRT